MQLHPVKSSNIEAIGHDPVRQVMHVKFTGGGKTFAYPGVSAQSFTDLMAAPSIGGHFAKHIRPKHVGTEVK